jgi:hypothetical protein
MASRGRIWTEEEIAALLAIWGDESIQRKLRGKVRNTVPYKAIAEDLGRQGFHRDFNQCREKIKALKKRYKEVVDAQRRSGAGVDSDDECPLGFRWFKEIDNIEGNRAVVCPPALLDTSIAESRSLVVEEQSTTPSVGEERSVTPSISDERSTTPSFGEERSITPSVEEELPITPSVREEQSMTPSVRDEHATTLSVGEEHTTTPSVGEEYTTTPSDGEEPHPTTAVNDGQPQRPPSEDIPGPSSSSSGRQSRLPKKRKPTKLDKVDKATKALVEAFKEMEEASREQDRLDKEKRMHELCKMREAEDRREERFMSFLKDLFQSAPPMLHQPHPTSVPPVPYHMPPVPPTPHSMPYYQGMYEPIPHLDNNPNSEDSESH